MNKGFNMVRCFTGGLLACLIATSAFAGVTSFTAVPVPAGPGAPAGFVTTDIMVSFTGQYTGSQLLTPVLAAGSIYQDAFGAASPPNAAFIGVFPSLAYDTYVAQGSATAGGADGEPSLGGGAVDLGGAPGAVFTNSQINQAWNPAGGVTISDRSDFLIARVTLATDLNAPLGSILALASAAGTPASIQGSVINGTIVFPSDNEPPILGDLGPLLGDMSANGPHEPTLVSGTLPANDDAPLSELAWMFDGASAGPGTPAIAPTLDPATGLFSWDVNGSKGGLYTFPIKATDAGGLSDGGLLTVNVIVPEPATVCLIGLALVGWAGFRRK